jgi:hypothetical protein
MKIPQRARQISPINVQVATPSLSTPNQTAYGTDIAETLANVTKATENIAKINYSMQDQRDEIALSTFKSNADLLSKAYVEDIKGVKDIKDIDLKKEQLEKEIEASAKGIVPDNIYNGWKAREGLVFNAEVNYATERIRTEKNIDKAKLDFAQTTLNYQNLAYLAKTPQQAQYYRDLFKTELDKFVAGDNQTGTKIYSQEESTKLLFGFDNQYDKTKIEELINGTPEEMIGANGIKTKVNSLGNPLQAIRDLQDKNKYKTFTPEERQKYTQEALKQSVILKGTSKDEVVNTFMTDWTPRIQQSSVLDNKNLNKTKIYNDAIDLYKLATDDLYTFMAQENLDYSQAISVRDNMAKFIGDPKGKYSSEENAKYERAIVRYNTATLTKEDEKFYTLDPRNFTKGITKLVGGNNDSLKSVGDVIELSQDLVKTANEMLDNDKKKDLLSKADLVGQIIIKNLKDDELDNGTTMWWGKNKTEYVIFDTMKQYYDGLKEETEEAVATSETMQVYNDFVQTNLQPIDYQSKDADKINEYKSKIVALMAQNEERRRNVRILDAFVVGNKKFDLIKKEVKK